MVHAFVNSTTKKKLNISKKIKIVNPFNGTRLIEFIAINKRGVIWNRARRLISGRYTIKRIGTIKIGVLKIRVT